MAEIGAAWGSGKDMFAVILPGSSIEPAAIPPTLQDAPLHDARQQTPAETADYLVQAVQGT
jgi:hypothetical protein